MVKENDIELEFADFLREIGLIWGFDDIAATLYSRLYIEPNEISIEELAKKSGYSLASVSNKMRVLEKIGMVNRIKKPKSKKVFYYCHKDIITLLERKFDKIMEIEINPAKNIIPSLILRCKVNNHICSPKKIQIIKNYYSQILFAEELLSQFRKTMHSLKEKYNTK